MGDIEIKIKNIEEIKRAFSKSPALMTKNLDRAIRQTILFIMGKSVANAPIRTGRLRASSYTSYGPLKGEVGFKAKYASYVHDGTSPYIINAKSGKALYWKGASHPVKRVRHPGIKANPFLRKAVENNELQIDKFFENAVQDTLDQIAKDVG